jgi:hypothetical protein
VLYVTPAGIVRYPLIPYKANDECCFQVVDEVGNISILLTSAGVANQSPEVKSIIPSPFLSLPARQRIVLFFDVEV